MHAFSNPALRSSKAPPAPAYPFMRQLGLLQGGGGGRRPPSWAEGWRGSEQEYAITVGSESSVAGGD